MKVRHERRLENVHGILSMATTSWSTFERQQLP